MTRDMRKTWHAADAPRFVARDKREEAAATRDVRRSVTRDKMRGERHDIKRDERLDERRDRREVLSGLAFSDRVAFGARKSGQHTRRCTARNIL